MEDSQLDTKTKTATTSHETEQEALSLKGDPKTLPEKFREWLNINKILFETVAVVVLPLAVVFILVFQVIVMQNQADIAKKQADISERQTAIAEREFLSNVEPLVSIGEKAESSIIGSAGVFTIKLKNIGIMDVYDVKIYVNYLICPCETMETGKYFKCPPGKVFLPSVSSLPSKQFQELKVGEEIPYLVDTKKVIDREKMLFPCFMRLRLDYKRKVDGKNFSKIFAFSVHGEVIINLERAGAGVKLYTDPALLKRDASIKDFLLNKF